MVSTFNVDEPFANISHLHFLPFPLALVILCSMTTGTWLHMLLLAVVVAVTTDWELEAKTARQRVSDKAKGQVKEFSSRLDSIHGN